MEGYETVPMGEVIAPPLARAKTTLLHLPQSKSVDIIFKDVCFSVSSGFFFNSRKKQVLKGVSGKFTSGELTAIMGPSGAGKSSLLNILTGFHRKGCSGTISTSTKTKKKLDGDPLDRKDSCYIMQDDNLSPLLTVREVMTIATDLKLDQDLTKKAKLLLVENIVDSVGLTPAMDTQCGRISGGQRKRLSIALELINNPPVMFLDEPTTGLDSQSTMQIVTLLKSLSRGGRNIICTLHQPSASVFELFDHVYIISRGYCVYQGASTNLVSFLQSVGLPCPQYHNPADFVMDVVSGEFGDHNQVLVDAATNSIWRGSPPKLLSDNFNCDSNSNTITHQKHPSEWFRFCVLFNRSLKLMFRDWTVIYLKLILHILVGLAIGALFQRSGEDGGKSISNLGYLMSTAVYLGYTSLMPAILKFPLELGIIKKEQFNNWYKLRTYYAAFQLANLPVQMFFCFQYTTISYYLTSQIMEADRFFMFLLVNMINIIISECMGLGLGTAINPVNGIFLGAVGICFMILMAGFLALLRDMPTVFVYVSYISCFRYTLEGMVLAVYGYGRKDMVCHDIYCHYKAPVSVLDEIGMRHGDYWIDVTVLSAMAVLSILYAYFSLRAKMK